MLSPNKNDVVPISLDIASAHVLSITAKKFVSNDEYTNRNIIFLAPVVIRAFGFTPGAWYPVALIASCHSGTDSLSQIVCPELNCVAQVQPLITNTFVSLPETTVDQTSVSFYGLSTSPSVLSHIPLDTAHVFASSSTQTQRGCPGTTQSLAAFALSPLLAARVSSYLAAVAVSHLSSQPSVAVPLSAHMVLSPTLATPRGDLATMRALRSGRSSTYAVSLSELESLRVCPVMTRTPPSSSATTSPGADVYRAPATSATHEPPQPVHLSSVRHPLTRTVAASLLARTLGPLGVTPSPLSCAAHAEATAMWHAGEWWRAESVYGWASSSELRVEEERQRQRRNADGDSEEGEDGPKGRRGRTRNKKAKSMKKDKSAGSVEASSSVSDGEEGDAWDEDDEETGEYDEDAESYLDEEEDEDDEVELDASGVREVVEALRKAEEKTRKEVSARRLARATRMLLLGRCEAEVEDAPAALSLCPAEGDVAQDRSASTPTDNNTCVSSSPCAPCSLCVASEAAPALALFRTHPSSLSTLLIALRDRVWAIRASANVTYRRAPAAFPLRGELAHTVSAPTVSSSSHAVTPQLSHAPMSLLRSVASSWAARASRAFHAHDALLESVCSHALSQALATSTARAGVLRHRCAPRVLPVLISGPSGCGKSALARAIAEAAPGPRVFLDAAQLTSGVRGEAAAELTAALRRVQPEGASAMLSAPMGVWRVSGACVGVAVLDDVDALSPVGEDEEEEGRHTRNEQELLAVLSALLRSDQCSLCSTPSDTSAAPVSSRAGAATAVPLPTTSSTVTMRPVLLVLMTTSRPHRLPAVLAQPALAPLRVSLDTLAVKQRVQLLSALLARIPLADSHGRLLVDSSAPGACSLPQASSTPSSSTEAARVIAAIAGSLHGYTGADVSRIVTEACLAALNRVVGADSDMYARVSQRLARGRSGDNMLSAFMPCAGATTSGILDDVPSFALQPCDWAAAFARVPGPAALAASGLALALDAADTPIEELLGSPPQADADDIGVPATSASSPVAAALTHAPTVGVRDVSAPVRVFPSAFDMLGGMEQPLRTLQHWLLEPLRAAASGQPAALPSGILLHGPPGSGKTTMSLCIAKACRLPIITANAATLVNKLVGGGEKAIRRLFDTARASAPCILLLDNIEAIAGSAKHAIDAQIDAHEAGNQSAMSTDSATSAPSSAASSPFTERTHRARRQFDKSGGRIKPPKSAASAAATATGSSAPERVPADVRGDIAPHAPSRLVTALLSELDDTITASTAGLLGAWDGHSTAPYAQGGVSSSAPVRPATAQQRVIVLATTRAPHTLPSHLLRPGRLGLHVSLPLPSLASRWEILAKRAARMPFAVRGPRATTVDEHFPCVRALLYWAARRMDGASAADLQAVVSGAAMHSIREIKANGDVTGDGNPLMAHPTILPHDLIHALRSLGFLRATDNNADDDAAAEEARLCLEEAAAIERVVRGGEEWYGPAGDDVHEVSNMADATTEPAFESSLPDLPLPTGAVTAPAAVELSALEDAVLLWGCSDSDSDEEEDGDEEEDANATDRLAVLRARRRIPT